MMDALSTSERRTRRAVEVDLPQLVQIDPVAVGGDRLRRQAMKSAIDDGHCVVLDTDSGVVGYVITAPAAFFGRDFISLLIVDADHRRIGVGRILLRAAAEAATTARVFTSTNESNVAMRCLLESENWEFSGRLDGLDDGDPELVYFVDTAPATRPDPFRGDRGSRRSG